MFVSESIYNYFLGLPRLPTLPLFLHQYSHVSLSIYKYSALLPQLSAAQPIFSSFQPKLWRVSLRFYENYQHSLRFNILAILHPPTNIFKRLPAKATTITPQQTLFLNFQLRYQHFSANQHCRIQTKRITIFTTTTITTLQQPIF